MNVDVKTMDGPRHESMSRETRLDPDKLSRLYKQARNRLWKLNPASVLNIAINLLHAASSGGVEVMQKYQPWNLLLLVRWTFERFDSVAHRRRDATLGDIHVVLNLIHEMEEHVRMPNEYEHLSLFLRHLAFQQFWLQHSANAYSLARQDLLFCRLPQEHRFQKEFFRLTGVCCEEFINLSLSLILVYQDKKSRYRLNQSTFQRFGGFFSTKSIHSFLGSLSLGDAEVHQMLTIVPRQDGRLWDQMLFPSPLRDFPLLRRENDFIVYSPKLLFRALEDFIYRRLKREAKEEFCSKFGSIFERYVGDRLSEAGVHYLNEQTLNSELTGPGKCVDFLVAEKECNILIEAKGVEISDRGLLSHEAEFVFRSIKESGGKAIRQGLESVRRMNLAGQGPSKPFGSGPNYLLVVTYDALHLGNSVDFEEIYGPQALNAVYQEFGKPLPLPLTNVFFVTIEEFECLLAAIYQKTTTFLAVIKRVQENDSKSGTRKFSFMQHIAEVAPDTKPLPALKASLERIIARVTSHLPAGTQSGS